MYAERLVALWKAIATADENIPSSQVASAITAFDARGQR
jgi:hypothetical protein